MQTYTNKLTEQKVKTIMIVKNLSNDNKPMVLFYNGVEHCVMNEVEFHDKYTWDNHPKCNSELKAECYARKTK
jgi:hypothetical protein